MAAAQGPGHHSAATIRDTLSAVFSAREYTRSSRESIATALLNAITRVFSAIARAFERSPALRTTGLIVAVALVVLLVARIVYGAFVRQRLQTAESAGGSARRGRADPWGDAQRAAERGNYTDAAHFLYAALLDILARRQRIALHPSKTAGDYARELRARSSPASQPFRAFVRAFEFVVYGHGECTRDQFEQLRSLAEPLVTSE